MRVARFWSYCCWLVVTVAAQEPGTDPAEKIKIAHAALASAAWVFFLPAGAILLRLLDGRKAVYVHASVQLFSVVTLVASAGQGIWLALDNSEISEAHCIIGLALFSLLFFQIASGVVHHLQYRKRRPWKLVSFVHVWTGRAIITLGMINGGLGLQLSDDASRGEYIAYGVVAAMIWLIWVGVDINMIRSKRGQSKSSVLEVSQNESGGR